MNEPNLTFYYIDKYYLYYVYSRYYLFPIRVLYVCPLYVDSVDLVYLLEDYKKPVCHPVVR